MKLLALFLYFYRLASNRFVTSVSLVKTQFKTLKEQRRLAGLTQQELADKIGTKKSYISKLENGHADVQLSTLFRIFAGLGKRVSVAIL